jgi:hypothetical protein
MYMKEDPFIKNSTFVFRVILAKSVVDQVRSPIPIGQVDCPNDHASLPCRVDKSYPLFLADFPQCDWLFRGEDDTWVQPSIFYHSTTMLNGQFNPREDVVFRAHANFEKLRKWYIHGGSGWLMSRAAVDLHVQQELTLVKLLPWARYHQQDTGQSIIVRQLFPDPDTWDEWGFQGFQYNNCNSTQVKNRDWVSLPECPASEVAVKLKDLMSLHTASLTEPVVTMIKAIPFAPTDTVLSRNNVMQRSRLCRNAPTTKIWDPADRKMVVLKLRDVPKPLFDYQNLPNDNYL